MEQRSGDLRSAIRTTGDPCSPPAVARVLDCVSAQCKQPESCASTAAAPPPQRCGTTRTNRTPQTTAPTFQFIFASTVYLGYLE